MSYLRFMVRYLRLVRQMPKGSVWAWRDRIGAVRAANKQFWYLRRT